MNSGAFISGAASSAGHPPASASLAQQQHGAPHQHALRPNPTAAYHGTGDSGLVPGISSQASDRHMTAASAGGADPAMRHTLN